MALRPVVLWPSKVLETPTQPVTDFGPALQQLIEDLLLSMRGYDGIGIAANQVGVPLRVAIVGREDGSWFEIVNPSVLSTEEPVVLSEGCLSVPDQFEQTPRFRKVRVRYQDRTGAPHELAAEDRLAHVLQHEIDHLEGHVFVSKLSSLKRQLIRSRIRKLKGVHPATEELLAKAAEKPDGPGGSSS
jgi:peptide deformylase